MTHPADISINDYTFNLPAAKIALYPEALRGNSRLLIYKNGNVIESRFTGIAEFLPANSLVVLNNTKVINARLRFQQAAGSTVEIFCLEPADARKSYEQVFSKKESAEWKCMVGGIAKWKGEFLQKEIEVDGKKATLTAKKIERKDDVFLIQFSWAPSQISFADIVEAAGDVPLPPYIKRQTDVEDPERYQTVYAQHNGSVAAPTAGLHFTKEIFHSLSEKNISSEFVTLHVGAGTFKPVKAEKMANHNMHSEIIDVSLAVIEKLKKYMGNICAVGTTSLRTLETLYWLGVKAAIHPELTELTLSQWEVYEEKFQSSTLPAAKALNALSDWMTKKGNENILTATQILIAPGYQFRMVKNLVTNFHQPNSTLLLLVAAAIGTDWRKVYDYALEKNFRFLSYGDGSLLEIVNGFNFKPQEQK